MRTVQCTRCEATQPIGETYIIHDQIVCDSCATVLFENRPPGNPLQIDRSSDPTVCQWCKKDASSELPLIANTPTCDECERLLRNRPFPTWIKLSFAVLLALAAASFTYNYRFMNGYLELRRANRAIAAADLFGAADHTEKAAAAVPEEPNLVIAAALFRGVLLMADDRASEALPKLVQYQRMNPLDPMGPQLVAQAEIGVAFNDKDYLLMVEKRLALNQLAPDEPMSKYSLASAYACQLHRPESPTSSRNRWPPWTRGPAGCAGRRRLSAAHLAPARDANHHHRRGIQAAVSQRLEECRGTTMIVPGIIVTLLTFPGVIVHEAAHLLFCKLRRVPVLDVRYFQVGNPAGYVSHIPTDSFLSTFLICIGPFIVNSVLCIVFCFPAFFPVRIFDRADLVSYFFLWLGMHAIPSFGDAQVLWCQATQASRRFHPLAILSMPLVVIIMIANIGSIFWLDLAYGVLIGLGLPELLFNTFA